VPKNVLLVPGGKCAANPLLELAARERHFLAAAKRFAGEVDAAVFYNAWGTRLARGYLKSKGVPLVFDYIDLMQAFRKNPVERAAALHSTIQAIKQSDLVVATAAKLREFASRHNENVALVPNGVDVAKMRKVKPKKITRPAVGFVGGFGDWVDFDAVIPAIKANSRAHFYFIGDGMQRGGLIEKTRGLRNAFVSETFAPYDEARKWMAAFDVCVVPFKINELTNAVCPLKLFEFWALRKPVVASPTFEIKRIASEGGGGGALFARTPAEWTRAIERLLSDEKLATRVAAAGFAKARRYDWRLLSERYRNELRKVVACR
jgi:glycosyltransferase involved in cell wall biosynthesis